MTRYDDETLMRRVDGELSPEAGAAIDAAAASDPALAGRLEALRQLRTLAREAVPIAPDPRDQALARLIAASSPATASASPLIERLRAAFAPTRSPVGRSGRRLFRRRPVDRLAGRRRGRPRLHRRPQRRHRRRRPDPRP